MSGGPSSYCKFEGCKNTSLMKGVRFFRFPKDKKRCKAWVDACKNPKLVGISPERLNSNFRICSSHFNDWCFMNINWKHRLVHNAIPDAPDPRIKVKQEKPEEPTRCSGTSSPIDEKFPFAHNGIQDTPDLNYKHDEHPTEESTKCVSVSNRIIEKIPSIPNMIPDTHDSDYKVDKQNKCPTKTDTHDSDYKVDKQNKCPTKTYTKSPASVFRVVVRFPPVHNVIPEVPDLHCAVDKQDKCLTPASTESTSTDNPVIERSPCLLSHLLQDPDLPQHTSVRNTPACSRSVIESSMSSPSSSASCARLSSVFNGSSSSYVEERREAKIIKHHKDYSRKQKQNSQHSSSDNQAENIQTLQQEFIPVILKEVENQNRVKDLLQRINELETINKCLKESYTENTNIQEELAAVKLREAEAQRYIEELLQKINNLQSQLAKCVCNFSSNNV